ncbi:MAG: methyltransferase domain-containing protein [Desulfuromonadales bacterium]|nr:methyltransferase domain-containing protein [Desulfuromonadales bacterium]
MSSEPRTTPEYWQKETGRFSPFEVRDNPFSTVLDRFLPKDSALTCVEIGAYPGGNLCYLTKRFGYKPFAIEYRNDTEDIGQLFEFNELPPPEIFEEDFLDFSGRTFDVVTSFGFVEHFDDPQAVICKHVEFLKPGGYLVLSVPHFGGMQGLLRKLVLTTEAIAELFATHNMDIMQLGAVKNALQGLDVLFLEHVMNGRFWISADSPKIQPNRRWLAKAISTFDRTLGSKLPSCGLVSPMILAVARKTGVQHA